MLTSLIHFKGRCGKRRMQRKQNEKGNGDLGKTPSSKGEELNDTLTCATILHAVRNGI